MKKKIKNICIVVIVIVGIASWIQLFFEAREAAKSDINRLASEIESAIKEVDENMEMAATTVDTPITYADAEGNSIIYHYLETEYLGSNPTVIEKPYQLVIDIETADTVQKCKVNDVDAILCREDDRAYLCWTLSPKYSFVIEYTPGTVKDDEIYIMAESLVLPEE